MKLGIGKFNHIIILMSYRKTEITIVTTGCTYHKNHEVLLHKLGTKSLRIFKKNVK